MSRLMRIIVLWGMVIRCAAAYADDNTLPAGITTDRVGTEEWVVNLDSTVNKLTEEAGGNYSLSMNLYGQYLAQVGRHRAGGYASIPYGFVSGEERGFLELGNLELGAVYVAAWGRDLNFIGRGGIVLETSYGSGEVALVANAGRLADVLTNAYGASWLRLSGSPLHRFGAYFVRVDLGLDIPFAAEADLGVTNPMLRLNAAVGKDWGRVALVGELSNLAIFFPELSLQERLLHTLALNLRWRQGGLAPCVGMVVPLDDYGILDFAVVAGIRITQSS